MRDDLLSPTVMSDSQKVIGAPIGKDSHTIHASLIKKPLLSTWA
jgi:hypothetical protein